MKPWDRRPTETDPAWIAFVAYRDLGANRTLPNVVKAVGGGSGKLRVVEGWSGRHEWVSRVRAFDSWLDAKVTQPAVARERLEMTERHLKLGRALQGRGAQGLNAIKPEKLKATEVAALLKAGVDIERVAAGEPTEIQAHTFAKDSRDRLRRLFGDEEASS